MVFIDEQYAVADCAVGKNLAAGKEWRLSPYRRLFTGFALVGANAALECCLVVKVNKVVIATLRNNITGLVIAVHEEWHSIGSMFSIDPNMEIAVEVVSAPTVSPIRLQMNLAEVA